MITTVQLGRETAVTPRILAVTLGGVVLVVMGGTVVELNVVDGHGLADLNNRSTNHTPALTKCSWRFSFHWDTVDFA